MTPTRGLIDTSVLIADETGRELEVDTLPDELAISVVTVGELRAGVLAAADVATRSRRLATLTEALALEPVPVDDGVAAAWAVLRVELREAGETMGVNDSWIAATAVHLGVPLVTQDRGIPDLPSLSVIRV